MHREECFIIAIPLARLTYLQYNITLLYMYAYILYTVEKKIIYIFMRNVKKKCILSRDDR